jgi:N-acetylmuramoyl-L-alanine amidase
MIAPLLFALQVAAASVSAAPSAPQVLVVRNASASQRVPLVTTPTGPQLRPTLLNPIVKVDVRRSAPGRYQVAVAGVPIDIEAGIPAVTVAGQVKPLAAAPIEYGRELLVPLQFVSEILPAHVSNLRWDAQSHQLVVFSSIERAAAAAKAAAPPAPPKPVTARHTVVVDAGHGGPDNGMTGPLGAPISLREKDVTLAVARRLGRELQARGMKVIYTRTSDTLIALSDRGRIANQAGGDLFLSVHVNAASLEWREPAAARGFETYFLSEARTEDTRRVERMENESVRFETTADVGKDDALSFILSDMKQNEHLRESAELADLVQAKLATMHPGTNRGVKQAGFRVLVTAFMPAVLIEIGFGTNPAEAQYLNNAKQQAAIASAIADAAVTYLQHYDRRLSGAGGSR